MDARHHRVKSHREFFAYIIIIMIIIRDVFGLILLSLLNTVYYGSNRTRLETGNTTHITHNNTHSRVGGHYCVDKETV